MGTLEYNSSHPAIEIDDVTLAHLKIVIGTKLRRQESFMMTWAPGDSGTARMTAWIHPSIPLVIAFEDPKPAPIDAERVAQMMQHLNAHGEIIVTR